MQEGIKVLMVEDDVVLSELLGSYLRNCGISVAINGDPTTVIEHLKKKRALIL